MIIKPLLSLTFLATQFVITISETFLYESKCLDDIGNFTSNSAYQNNLYNLLNNLSSHALTTEFYNSSIGHVPDQVYGLYLCRGDVDSEACSGCVDIAKDTILERCPNRRGALIWYDECMLRYSNQSFFGKMDSSPMFPLLSSQDITRNETGFGEVLGIMINHLVAEAANDQSGKKYATGVASVSNSQTMIYAMGQCTPDLTPTYCDWCLGMAFQQVPVVHPLGARVMLPSCNIRYETYPFFRVTANQPGNYSTGTRKLTQHLPVLVAVPTSVAILLGVIGILICLQKRKTIEGAFNLDMEEIRAVESLQLDLNTIRAATRNFSQDNKLGQGGFGQVFKGKLGSGQEVAIKRLSENSGQGIAEFKTEVILVAKLQHKNLVKLLGFCVESKEKILVYEFLPNTSLDRFLFDPTKTVSLDWETRYKIILGIARGLLYLHEDSRLKIIHRDLKSSNILLDENMNPKISDFGLAKLFGVDQTQGDTKRIVGTYGYMAPEYAITGHFSVKSDVFSFGVIVLEIVSSQKNRFFGRIQVEEALLHRAWRLWDENKVLDLVDPALDNTYQKEELLKCIQIGLLCIQEDASERPRMASVVAALNGHSVNLPMPNPPHFFGNMRISRETSSTNTNYTYTGSENISDLHPR